MKKSIITIAALAMVLTLSSCKETTAETTEETSEEASAVDATVESIPAEELEMETVNDSTIEVDATEITPVESEVSDKE